MPAVVAEASRGPLVSRRPAGRLLAVPGTRLGEARVGDSHIGEARVGELLVSPARIGESRIGRPRVGEPDIGQAAFGQPAAGESGAATRGIGEFGLGGLVEAGRGPATQRTGTAFVAARAALDETRRTRTSLRIVTGDPGTDPLLADLAPVLGAALEQLSPTQRRVASLIVVDGLRRSEVADRLAVSRATVSVAASRGEVPSLERLARAIRTLIKRSLPGELGN